MPEKPLTVITYAASVSLAAIALVYFFNPNYLIDGEASTSSASARKKGIVGLSNPGNDCFINSVLQALAGLGELRLYLIREVHRRRIDGPDIYSTIPDTDGDGKTVNAHRILSLQSGEVTQGLKDIIDGLNERPIYKKTISATNFISVLEHAFATRISKSQQDAQELLQILAERLSEEYHAGIEARKRVPKSIPGTDPSKGSGVSVEAQRGANSKMYEEMSCADGDEDTQVPDIKLDEEHGFPLEGRTSSEIECQHCQFVPKANQMSFVMLTLPVPQKSSATLNECFDAHFKTEYIDDYRCDKCRLEHALAMLAKNLNRTNSERHRTAIQKDMTKLQKAIEEDPEKPPEGVVLPDVKLAPKRRIARHVQITTFPKVLIIHLSRSIYDARSSSTKNAAKVSFPERLPIGGLLNRRNYKLLGMVSHKGTHNSGHYESFRRQHLYAPYSTPHVRKPAGLYSATPTPDRSTQPSPNIAADPSIPSGIPENRVSSSDGGDILSPSTVSSSPSISSTHLSPPSTRPSSGSTSGVVLPNRGTPALESKEQDTSNMRTKRSVPSPFPEGSSPSRNTSLAESTKLKRKKLPSDRWWRISDDKIKECKLGDVLAMQKEVYLLFYEMEKG